MTYGNSLRVDRSEAVEESAGWPDYSNSTPYPARIRLSDTAENYLSQLAVDLTMGRCEFTQLSPALREMWVSAWVDGRLSRQPEVDNLNARADALYLQAFNPKERALEIQTRLDRHFSGEAERFFAEVAR